MANLVNQADRIVMSIAIVPMGYDLHLTPFDKGWILSAFSYGYITTQVAAGPLAKKYGPGLVLSVALVGWCSLTILTPVVATTSISLLLFIRVLMGICEGFCWPSTYTWISHSVEVSRRARSFTLLIAGGTAGQLVALLICPRLNWPMMFVLFGLAGFAWVTLYAMSSVKTQGAPDTELCASCSIYQKMLRCPPVVAILTAHVAHNWGYQVLVNWLPTYLHAVLGVSKEELWIAALPLAMTTFVSPFYGVLADKLHSNGMCLLYVRRVMTTIGLLGPGIIFIFFPYVTSQAPAIMLICLCYITHGCLGPGVFSNHADILPVHAGMAFGLGNTFANAPGMVIGPFTAWLIANGNNWAPVFHVAAALNFIGAAVYLKYSRVDSIEHEVEGLPADDEGADLDACYATPSHVKSQPHVRVREAVDPTVKVL